MSQAYSSKALPPGTIIREWRLEEVLGVGGFGIVYKGRGIYFGELVAIKEYFPSAISERDAEDTVVPIGSDVEEVHALGLKKFVEEAKLLWNLSTPTRHPNIVSVRSLFEIRGTAYMVMDFEDGVSLSKLLKEGRRFNERSLWNIIKPIAEGLDRAHRVGVLHRDIKPPNILITDDNRPVLIDFGSARFEAAEATSTTVTFHTPPYAAVEQYVKTYPQGPWTDIYALAVVLYECVTGEKPPEVLERLHGGLGTPLADGHWPGFSRKFLQAIDAGMTIRPTERPQAIRDWLALFGKKDVEAPPGSDDEPTRFFAHEVAAEEIVPVAALAADLDKKESLETGVPKDPSEVQFKKAGQETKPSKRKMSTEEAAAAQAEEEAPTTPPAETPAPSAEPAKKSEAAVVKAKAAPREPLFKDSRKAMLVGGGAVALLAAVATGVLLTRGDDSGNASYDVIPAMAPETTKVELADVIGIAADERALADEAQKAGVPATIVKELSAAGDKLDSQLVGLRPLLEDDAQASAAIQRADEMKQTAVASNLAFANALLRDAEGRAQGLSAVAITSPAGARLSDALGTLRTSVQQAASAADPVASLAAARDVLAKSQAFAATIPDAHRADLAAAKRETIQVPILKAAPTQVTRVQTAPATVSTATATAAPATAAPSGNKTAQLRSVVASARSRARQVIAMGNSGPDIRKTNAKLAKNYDKYLASLSDSMRGARTDREVDQLLRQANQTKAYVDFLYKQSSEAR